MAILYAVWGIGLLGMIAVSFLSSGTVTYALSANAREQAQQRVAAEAALSRVILALLDPRPDRRWRVDGTAQDFAWGEFKVGVAVQDELGRIDLNHAEQGLLTGLFRSAGLGSKDANDIVDKILDWRDGNGGRRLNGATAQDYRAAGYQLGPRNGAFQSVDELQLVIGMTKALYARVEPALTVHSGRPFIDPKFAPREALLALPAMNEEVVANSLAVRTAQGSKAGVLDPTLPLGGRTFSVRMDLPSTHGSIPYDAVVRLTDHPRQPYQLLSWRSK